MIYDSLKHLDAYEGIYPQITRALKIIRDSDFSKQEDGPYEVDGFNFRYMLQSYTLDKRNETPESHKDFIDIQYMISGKELMGVAPIEEMTEVVEARPEGDIWLHRGPFDTVTVTGETPDLNLSYEKAMAKTDVAHQQLVIVMGTPDRSLDTEALMEAILAHYYANDYTPIDFSYSVTEPDALDLDALYAAHTIAPVDAVLDESDYSITHETLGYGFVLDALKALVAAAGEGETVTVPFSYLPAAVTYESIDATLFQDVLGSVSTNHTNDANRNTNLKLACKAINGKLIRPGETFSYNATLGERTEKKGYKPAGAYMAGKSVQTVGGGICQVSSTLYYACLKADLEIVERTAHGFTVSYMPYGMDATVSWGSLDYKFKNNTDYPIRIEAWVSGGQVHVKLIGTDTKDYYVKMTYETVEGPTEGKVVYEDYKWDNKEGYKDGEVLQTAYTGRTVKSYRQKFDKATDKLISSEYEATSRYKSRDKIIARVEPKPQPSGRPSFRREGGEGRPERPDRGNFRRDNNSAPQRPAPVRAAAPVPPPAPKTKDQQFEDMMKAFMSESDSKLSGMRADHRTKSRRR